MIDLSSYPGRQFNGQDGAPFGSLHVIVPSGTIGRASEEEGWFKELLVTSAQNIKRQAVMESEWLRGAIGLHAAKYLREDSADPPFARNVPDEIKAALADENQVVAFAILPRTSHAPDSGEKIPPDAKGWPGMINPSRIIGYGLAKQIRTRRHLVRADEWESQLTDVHVRPMWQRKRVAVAITDTLLSRVVADAPTTVEVPATANLLIAQMKEKGGYHLTQSIRNRTDIISDVHPINMTRLSADSATSVLQELAVQYPWLSGSTVLR